MGILRLGARAVESSDRNIFIGATLALCINANALFVIAYGLVGTQGNSPITGAFLITCETALFYVTRRPIKLQVTDWLFCLFILFGALSFVINGRTASTKDTALFAIALGAYPAVRCLSFSLPQVQRSFILITASLVAVGTILTACAIVSQWGGPYVRPLVLGVNDAAATFFLIACGLLIIGVIATGLDRRKSLLLSAFVLLPGLVFSASLVRATFIAIVATLVLELVLAESRQRMNFAIVISVFLISIILGLTLRNLPSIGVAKASGEMLELKKLVTPTPIETPISSTQEYPGRIKKKASADTNGDQPPSCTADVNMSDSIAIRRALFRDALWLVRSAGLFGVGFGNFTSITCIEMEVHNSYLQALVELGWLSGLFLCAALAVTLCKLTPHYRRNDGVRFAFGGLVYVAMLSAVHGALNEDRLLFAMLGLAASACEALERGADRPKS